MKKIVKYFLIYFAAVVLPLVSAIAAPIANTGAKGGAPTEILVKFSQTAGAGIGGKAQIRRSSLRDIKSQIKELADAAEVGSVPQIGVTVIKVNDPETVAKLLENNEHVVYAEPNFNMEFFITPNDANWKTQASALGTIGAQAGWDFSTGANSPIIAVVDSGVAAGHPDLPKLLPGHAVVAGLSPNSDTVGHGTGVAGTIGMIGNNKIGGAGINWNASILPVKVDDANGTLTVVNGAKGILWAADNGARVINCSWGSALNSATLRDAVDYAYNKGAAIFAATGNSGYSSVSYPARYANVMAVGGTTDGKTRAATAQYGPGIGVVSINSFYTSTRAGGYSSMSGTSFASPQVAGLASLIFALKPNATPAQVYEFIQNGARPLGGGYNEQTGHGIIDMGKTLGLAAAAVEETPRLCRCACKGEVWPPVE